MKKFIIFILLLFASLFTVHVAYAKWGYSCLPEGITFTTQSQIDSFQVNYPGCMEIEGDVTILGEDIINVIGLSVVTSIGGDLTIGGGTSWNGHYIGNPLLTGLTGLSDLTFIGRSLYILGNQLLTSLTGLENLTSIGSSLSIISSGLINLAGLEGLNNIPGDLMIEYNSLTSLNGLESLNTIGTNLYINQNHSIISLEGLDGLTSLGGSLTIGVWDFFSCGNSALTSLTGLDDLQTIGGALSISSNHALSSLEGLDGLTFIGGGMLIYDNPVLVNLFGLENLNSIAGSLNIKSNCSFISFNGLESIESIGDLNVEENSSLVNLAGLENLNSIAGYLGLHNNNSLSSLHGLENIESVGSLEVQINPSLVNLNGLVNLNTIAGSLLIIGNGSLTSLNGMDSLTFIGENLTVIFNSLLSDCDVQGICMYLSDSVGVIEIQYNAPGCNSPEGVEAACEVGVEEPAVGSQQSAVSVYPNPTGGIVDFQISNFDGQCRIDNAELTILKVYNAQGQEVATILDRNCSGGQVVRWDASELPPGIYYYRLQTADRRLTTGKLVKY